MTIIASIKNIPPINDPVSKRRPPRLSFGFDRFVGVGVGPAVGAGEVEGIGCDDGNDEAIVEFCEEKGVDWFREAVAFDIVVLYVTLASGDAVRTDVNFTVWVAEIKRIQGITGRPQKVKINVRTFQRPFQNILCFPRIKIKLRKLIY